MSYAVVRGGLVSVWSAGGFSFEALVQAFWIFSCGVIGAWANLFVDLSLGIGLDITFKSFWKIKFFTVFFVLLGGFVSLVFTDDSRWGFVYGFGLWPILEQYRPGARSKSLVEIYTNALEKSTKSEAKKKLDQGFEELK